ncbi:MAG TPA: SlyX family protein [Opitutaceae bacterium]|nr:SlyX family protein [Opitutaceae bacterium]
MSNDSAARLANLETRHAFLERHVAQQDRAMLEMAERIDRLEARLRHMAERAEQQGSPGGDLPLDEKPPHY